MERRSDARIMVMTHKKLGYAIPDNKLHQPIEIGACFHNEPIWETRDNTGISFSELNPILAEGTGILWARHNMPDTIKTLGHYQYRRWLPIDEDTDFDELFKTYNAILPMPYALGATIKKQYCNCHIPQTYDIMREIIFKDYPEFSKTWEDRLDNGNILFYSTAFVMPRQQYNDCVDFLYETSKKLCEALGGFTVNDIYKYTNDNCPKDRLNTYKERGYFYQAQIPIFFWERLITLWVFNTFKTLDSIKLLPYTKMDGA